MENWVSILEYARLKDISISTIRRHIKAERVNYKLEDGKYFILVSGEDCLKRKEGYYMKLEEENKQLKNKLDTSFEEVAELKMLVAAYEIKKNRVNLPALPE